MRGTIDACAGYGGGLSAYLGLSAGLQLLDVAFFSFSLLRSVFSSCTVMSSFRNVYGGGASVYVGGHSSSVNGTGAAVAVVGDTVVLNASINVEAVSFTSCSAKNTQAFGNAYGGSFSLYVGGYAYSQSSRVTRSACGTIISTGLIVSIGSSIFANSSAVSSTFCFARLVSCA